MSAISATAPEPAFLPFASLAWFKRQLAPTPERARRTAIMVGAAVLCVIISMTLQVPELSVTAYMPFFVSKESKHLTTITGLLGFIGADHRHWRVLSYFTSSPMVIPNCAFPEWRSRCFLECGCRAFLCSGRSDSSSVLLSLSRSRSEKQSPHLNC